MKSRISTLSILASLSVAACGGSGPAPNSPATVSGGGEASVASSSNAPRNAPSSGGMALDAESAAPAAAPAPAEEVAKAEGERPGLGTSWGESVSSHVSSTSFYRQSEDSPDALAAFYYNDEAGISAVSRGRYVDYGDSVASLAGGRITVSLVDSSGSPLRAARLDGHMVAVGSDGDRYVVRVENHTPVRVEAVATVDGLDVIDGSDGDLNKRGYVIAPYDTLEIEGFRESEGSVRAFRFGKVSDSYAARRGKDRNVGVVGVALFRERGSDLRWTPEEIERRRSADPFPSHFAPPPPPSAYRGW